MIGSRPIHLFHILAIALFATTRLGLAQSGPPSGYAWTENPGNGHFYALTASQSWASAANEADSLGLNVELCTIRNRQEGEWLFNEFQSTGAVAVWIGLSDQVTEGDWRWRSGEAVQFLDWAPGEPNSAGGNEDEGELFLNHPSKPNEMNSYWNDGSISSGPKPAILEYVPDGQMGSYIYDDFEDGVIDPDLWNVVGPGTVTEANDVARIEGRGHLTTKREFDPFAQALRIEGEFQLIDQAQDRAAFALVWRAEAGVNGSSFEARRGAVVSFWSPAVHGSQFTDAFLTGDQGSGQTFDQAAFQVNQLDRVHFVITDTKGDVVVDLENLTTGMSTTLHGFIPRTTSYGDYVKAYGRESPNATTVDLEWIEIGERDSDRDGLRDALEDLNGNGALDPGETDPLDQDTDDDGLSDGEEVNQLRTDSRWLQGPNGSYYRLAPADSWGQANLDAVAQGRRLTSIQDLAEASWLADVFGEVSGGFWIGLTSDLSGNYSWSDGDTSAYRRWATGEPGGPASAAYVGGPNTPEPGYWYTDAGGNGPYMAVWESPGQDAPLSTTDPLNWDTDGDGLGDGQEDGLAAIVWNGDLDGDGNPDVGGTDSAFFIPDADPLTTTDPLDLDSDEDGLPDGVEDLDGDGARSTAETDAAHCDSDGDGLPDGLELGLASGTLDTDGSFFVPDADPATTTDPLLRDSDRGGVGDGIEDQNRDGRVDTWETDPNLQVDEALAFYANQLSPGQKVHFEVYNATPYQNVIPAYSTRGPGPTPTSLGLSLDLSMPITVLNAYLSNRDGRISAVGPRVPGGLALGVPIWLQAVEIPISSTLAPRASNPLMLPVGEN